MHDEVCVTRFTCRVAHASRSARSCADMCSMIIPRVLQSRRLHACAHDCAHYRATAGAAGPPHAHWPTMHSNIHANIPNARTSACMQACKCTYKHMCMHIQYYIHLTCVHRNTCTYMHVHIDTWTHTHALVYITHIQAYRHEGIHLCMHT